MTAPCLDCPDRHDGCHGKCKKYQAFRNSRIRISRERRKSTSLNNLFVDDAHKAQKINRRKRK